MTPLNGSPPTFTPNVTSFDLFKNMFLSGVTEPIELALRLQISIQQVHEFMERLKADVVSDH